MEEELSLSQIQKEWHGTLKAYVIGFFGSLILTGLSFYLAWSKILTGLPLVFTLVVLAIIQAIVQVRFFLHVGEEPKPRWETLLFLFMTLVLLIIVLGTLWIMFDLNNRVMGGMNMLSKEMHHD